MTTDHPPHPTATARNKRILQPCGTAVVEATIVAATTNARLHGLGVMGAVVACLSAAEIVALDLSEPAQRETLIELWSAMLDTLKAGARNAELHTVKGHA